MKRLKREPERFVTLVTDVRVHHFLAGCCPTVVDELLSAILRTVIGENVSEYDFGLFTCAAAQTRDLCWFSPWPIQTVFMGAKAMLVTVDMLSLTSATHANLEYSHAPAGPDFTTLARVAGGERIARPRSSLGL